MCKEHQIALKVINQHIDSGKNFTYDQITEEILQNEGILRVSIGVTIRMYLKNLIEIGLLAFDPQKNVYKAKKDALANHHNLAY